MQSADKDSPIQPNLVTAKAMRFIESGQAYYLDSLACKDFSYN